MFVKVTGAFERSLFSVTVRDAVLSEPLAKWPWPASIV